VSPSPIKFSDSTVSTMRTPGRAVRYHAVRISSRPAPIMLPQLTTLGSPRPRKDRAASIRMAVATITDAVTIMAGKALGRISRIMIRTWPKPRLRAAITNSFSRSTLNSARTSRAMVGHVTRPMAQVTVTMEGCAIATSTTSRMKLGTVWNSSISRTRTSSIRPPRYPATAPMAVPTVRPIVVATKPISNDTRAPCIRPAATSRPSESVPSGNATSCPGHRSGRATIDSGSAG